MNNKFSVGLDIGTTKIVAMVGEKNQFNKIKVTGVGKSQSLGVHRGVVNNITQTIQSIKIAVDEAQSKSGMEITEVAVGIAGQHIRSLQHSDYITRENPDEVINNEDIDKLILDAEKKESDSNHIQDFTRNIKAMDKDNKIEIIKSVWSIILSDGNSDIYEENLMRRLAGLLYLDAKTMGEIKIDIQAKKK